MPETAERAGQRAKTAIPVAQVTTAKSPGMPIRPPASGKSLLAQTLPISIPRNLLLEVQVRGDELKKEDLAKIKSQITRWLEGLEEAFDYPELNSAQAERIMNAVMTIAGEVESAAVKDSLTTDGAKSI